MIYLALSIAAATPGFDPSAPAARFTGEEIYTQDGEILLWSAIERLEDPDRTLMAQEEFTPAIAWPSQSEFAPWIAQCFGDSEPGSWSFLLHMALGEATSAGTPILLVPGAGDNGSRGFITMATRLNNNLARPVYALTFAHPHGDAFRHAEAIADAIARIKHRTGAEQVDVIAHSKGGIAAAIYLSNAEGSSWNRADYEAVGTRYRGDVRKAIFIATPLGGIDTAYRWPNGNYLSLTEEETIAPASWETYYPSGSAYSWIKTDLKGQDFLSEGGDPFPGHRQLLARWDGAYPLPGSDASLGYYAAQQDWYTTYHGGIGFFSYSSGIDAAIAEGDDVLGSLAANGVDPGVRIYLLAGDNPLMPNGTIDYLYTLFDATWVDLGVAGAEVWGAFVAELAASGALSADVSESEIQGLAQGKLMLGEVTGESDGLVFVESALQAETLTGRGAAVVDAHVANLSHLDLLYASDVTGALLIEASEEDPVSNGWMQAVGERYAEENSLAWVESALAEDEVEGPGDTGDSGEPEGDDTAAPIGDSGGEQNVGGKAEEPTEGGCGACSTGAAGGTGAMGWAALLALIARRRR